MHKGLFFPTPSPTIAISCFLDNGHSYRCEVISHGFNLHSMMITDVEQLFMCILVIYMPSLEKWIFRSPAYSEIMLFAFAMLCCRSFLYILDFKLFIRCIVCKYLLPFSRWIQSEFCLCFPLEVLWFQVCI